MHLKYDKVIVVYVREEVQVQRLMARDLLTRTEATARVNAQMPLREKIEAADFVIDNEGSLSETEEKVKEVFRQLIADK